VRSDGAPVHGGLRHEAAFYGSEDEFLAVVVPFLVGGVESGEPTVATFRGGKAELIRAAIGDTAHISWLDADTHYIRPASAIRAYRDLLVEQVAGGAKQIRVVGEIPPPGTGLSWDWWIRYEAALNHVCHDFPLWVTCTYDTRTTPAKVLDDVARIHPHLVSADSRHVANTRFEDPPSYLTGSPVFGTDPLETGPPVIDMAEPTPAEARHAIQAAHRTGRLDHVDITDLIYAVNEAVTNAICYGVPPVRLRVWSGPDRMVATVNDRGHGPTDPCAGLLPPTNSPKGGAGLWLIHQMCSNVTLSTDDDGFTIRLVTLSPSG
jgi:anti-sigma regulatory factor (Ser/Thr protein kinase)